MPKLLVLGAAVAALAAAGCGGGGGSTGSTTAATSTPASSGGSSSSGASSNLSLAADSSGKLAFDKTSLSAKSGKVVITMDNPAAIPHGIAVKGNGVNATGKVVNSGGKSFVTVNLEPGTYEFFCPVPGHGAAGMKGTLTVK